ncbi:hypothetical protein PCANC_04394 [Puccinia coronata f. sp. avenae]|uniref:Uncharacterized protein n=1 Tax=Puccinia coronata f. sp. avenae TaxID=200324 RepID=A0A2N5VFD4_9BASI|nr:hypothetical protein PCANC_04394 [Puccinia coronata f. sp. avenae]PLW48702.1 hypothetical protein PCASD_03180 [Puccinia coronata f. sp. avenae]
MQQFHNLQRLQDAAADNIGGDFGDLNPADKRQKKAIFLLWSAKSALFKATVKLQAETQPLRASKDLGKRIGTQQEEKIYAAIKRRKNGVVKAIKTFCKQRKAFLTVYAPAEPAFPNNQDLEYKDFMKMSLTNPFWNDMYLCLSQEPWSVDPVVQTGIHAILGLEQLLEELQQLRYYLRRSLSWAVKHLNKLKDFMNRNMKEDTSLDTTPNALYGKMNIPGVQNQPGGSFLLLGGDLFMEQLQHKQLMLSWNNTINLMMDKQMIA